MTIVPSFAERLQDPTYLPSHADFKMEFGTDPEDREASARWSDFIHRSQPANYEILNKEFVGALGSYIAGRAASMDEVPVVVEVAAGNGRLTHFLNQYLKGTSQVRVIATDSGEWGEPTIFPVQKLNCVEAIAEYNPDIVLCSWMPLGVDLTKPMREGLNTKEYLIIGEGAGGCCGDDEGVWGVVWTDDGDIVRMDHPAYELDGFRAVHLGEIRQYQVCRTDALNKFIHSQTVSFRRD